MSNSPRVSLLPVFALLFGLLLAGPISTRFAYAEAINGENIWTVMDVISAVNRAIDESKSGVELREKAVGRFAECSLMYGGLSRKASTADARQNYVQAQLATMEIETAIAQPLEVKRKLEIETVAQNSVIMTLDLAKSQGDKQLIPFIKGCRSLNDVKEISNVLRELSRE